VRRGEGKRNLALYREWFQRHPYWRKGTGELKYHLYSEENSGGQKRVKAIPLRDRNDELARRVDRKSRGPKRSCKGERLNTQIGESIVSLMKKDL